MNNTTYYQRNRNVILNRVKKYYKNDKERLKEQARNTEIYLKRIRIKRENMEETDTIKEKKQKLKEYQKNYRESKKSQCNN